VSRGEKDSCLGSVGVAFAVCVAVAIPFSLQMEGNIRGGNRMQREVGGEFLFQLSRFNLDSRGGRRWRLRQQG